MNRLVSCLAGLMFLLLLAGGCSHQRHSVNTIVLTPDPNGHLGRAEVLTEGGKLVLDTPMGMTTVTGRSSAPTAVTIASEDFISSSFAEAMAIEPTLPEKFILYFNNGTAELIPKSRADISLILESIKRRKAVSINISGHTDATGSFQLNERLARCRARSVSNLLIQRGVDEKLMTVTSHGKGNQLIPTADGVAEPRNRRVEVIVR